MFGKMKRTKSMMGITVENNHLNEAPQREQGGTWNDIINGQDQFKGLFSPRYSTATKHVGLLQAENHHTVADFLRTCGFCHRRLVPGRDIYMYRGDTAFCSEECREDQMKKDEKKENRKLASHHRRSPETASSAGTTTTDGSYAEAALHY